MSDITVIRSGPQDVDHKRSEEAQTRAEERMSAFARALENTPLDWSVEEASDEDSARGAHLRSASAGLREILAEAERAEARKGR